MGIFVNLFNNFLNKNNTKIAPKKDIKPSINLNSYKSSDKYLKLFENVTEYDINKNLDEKFLLKIKNNKDPDYDKFIKFSGTANRPTNFIAFDLETTGLNPVKHEIIEIGAIRFKDNIPVEIFHTYIKPRRKISDRITKINGITNEMVESSPSIEHILPKFIDFIGDDVLVAHNAEFDMEFMLDRLCNLGYKKIKNKVIDTLKLSRQKVREYDSDRDKNVKLESYSLEYMKDRFFLSDIPSHNAIDDCKVCAFIYIKIVNEDGDICCVDF